ncbi:hypothetical protein [Geotalea toluenoxydans]|uniref:hypothetical protein n=1 Tax=Geotalea toluenoxydans TaxID=421624 RepID=UPI000ABB7927
MPLVVTYGAETQSKLCASCHKKAYDLLMASTAKHKSVLCVTCHQSKHKMVPKCQDCHGLPHPAGMMAKFPKCSQCHNIAHDLNHWSADTTPEGAAQGAKKSRCSQEKIELSTTVAPCCDNKRPADQAGLFSSQTSAPNQLKILIFALYLRHFYREGVRKW